MIAAALLDLTLPSLPNPLTGLHAAMATGCAALGAALVLRGLRLSRWLMMVTGAAVGLVLAGPVGMRMPDVSPIAVCIVLASMLAIIAFITARMWIGLLAGALAGSATMAWLLRTDNPGFQPPDLPKLYLPDTTDLALWTSEFYGQAWQYLVALAKSQTWQPLILIGAAAVIPLVLALIFRKLMTIITTSAVGAVMVMVGAVAVASFANSLADPQGALLSRTGLIALCCIAAAGIVFQIITTYFKRSAPAQGQSAE